MGASLNIKTEVKLGNLCFRIVGPHAKADVFKSALTFSKIVYV